VAEPVLEVDAEIFDRFARELFDHARVHTIGKTAIDAEHLRERGCVRRVIVERAQRKRAKLLCRVGREQVGAAVHRVNRLAARRVAGKELRGANVGLVERLEKRVERVLGIVVSAMTQAV